MESKTRMAKKSEERYRLLYEKLQQSLKEKEALLKEVYHRVKNNLQVVSSLLNLQIETTKDASAKRILIESASRVKSMALVHEMFYQTENLAQIEIGEYIQNLLKYLYQIYDIDSNHIKAITDIDMILVNIDTAIPIGLIINELISNSFKHAFPDNKPGKITLSLKKPDDKIILTVSDNGIGISPKIDINNMSSLGMQLVLSLTRQLGGHIALDRSHGTTFTLTANAKP